MTGLAMVTGASVRSGKIRSLASPREAARLPFYAVLQDFFVFRISSRDQVRS